MSSLADKIMEGVKEAMKELKERFCRCTEKVMCYHCSSVNELFMECKK